MTTRTCQWEGCNEPIHSKWHITGKYVCHGHATHINTNGREASKLSANNLRTFETGATRSTDADAERYDLISEIGLERLARRYALGAGIHGDHNWRKGTPFSVTLCHTLYHINKFKAGDRSEDHLAAAAWGLMALMEFQTTHPELNDLYAYQSAGRGSTDTHWATSEDAAVRAASAHAASSSTHTAPHQEPDSCIGHSLGLQAGPVPTIRTCSR